MKIISQSVDELVLKEGGASGIVIGIVFVVAGVLVGYYRYSSNPIDIWIALALVVIGLVAVLFSSSITVNANRASGQLFYQKKRLIGGQNKTYAISDILRIEARKQWRMDNIANSVNRGVSTPQRVLVVQWAIVFKEGRELPLDYQKTFFRYVGWLLGGQGTEVAVATQVANFLSVPFQEIAPRTSGAVQSA
jgi:hypothetical protein